MTGNLGEMEESSSGAVVPAAKGETRDKRAAAAAAREVDEEEKEKEKTEEEEGELLDKELLCPICMQIIKDAFLTSCGHSFCYMCIVTHLQNKSDCPCCSHFLTPSQLYPNFLLDKVERIFRDSILHLLVAYFVVIVLQLNLLVLNYYYLLMWKSSSAMKLELIWHDFTVFV